MVLIGWLKSRSKAIAVCAAVNVMFAASYFLFQMPIVVVLYPLIVSVLICLVAAAVDYASFCARHRKLEHNELPAPSCLIESDY